VLLPRQVIPLMMLAVAACEPTHQVTSDGGTTEAGGPPDLAYSTGCPDVLPEEGASCEGGGWFCGWGACLRDTDVEYSGDCIDGRWQLTRKSCQRCPTSPPEPGSACFDDGLGCNYPCLEAECTDGIWALWDDDTCPPPQKPEGNDPCPIDVPSEGTHCRNVKGGRVFLSSRVAEDPRVLRPALGTGRPLLVGLLLGAFGHRVP